MSDNEARVAILALQRRVAELESHLDDGEAWYHEGLTLRARVAQLEKLVRQGIGMAEDAGLTCQRFLEPLRAARADATASVGEPYSSETPESIIVAGPTKADVNKEAVPRPSDAVIPERDDALSPRVVRSFGGCGEPDPEDGAGCNHPAGHFGPHWHEDVKPLIKPIENFPSFEQRTTGQPMPDPFTPKVDGWALQVIETEDSIKTVFSVGVQHFTIAEGESDGRRDDEDRERCEWFRKMFLRALEARDELVQRPNEPLPPAKFTKEMMAELSSPCTNEAWIRCEECGESGPPDRVGHKVRCSVVLQRPGHPTPEREPVVWANAATPFTGPQVLDLLHENQQFRAWLVAIDVSLGIGSLAAVDDSLEELRLVTSNVEGTLKALREAATTSRQGPTKATPPDCRDCSWAFALERDLRKALARISELEGACTDYPGDWNPVAILRGWLEDAETLDEAKAWAQRAISKELCPEDPRDGLPRPETARQPGDPTVRHVVAWMRATYPQNEHAQEWADEIDHVFLGKPRGVPTGSTPP